MPAETSPSATRPGVSIPQGASEEEALYLALEQVPDNRDARLALAGRLVARGQYAAARKALEGVTLGPEHATLEAAIARGTKGQPLGRPVPPRAGGIGWWSVSWRFGLVVFFTVVVFASVAWAPALERSWRVRRARRVLARPVASASEKIHAAFDLVRLAADEGMDADLTWAITRGLPLRELEEADAIRALQVYESLNAALFEVGQRLVEALGHNSARVRRAAADQIVRSRQGTLCSAFAEPLGAAVLADDDVAVLLMREVERSHVPELAETVLKCAQDTARPAVRVAALTQLAERLSSRYDPRAAAVLREAQASDPALIDSLGYAGRWLVRPSELDGFFRKLRDDAANLKNARLERTEIVVRKLALITRAQLEAAAEHYPDGTVRNVIFEAEQRLDGARRP